MLQVSPHLCKIHDDLCQWLMYDLWQWAGSRYMQCCGYIVLYHSFSSAPQSYTATLNPSDHFSSSCIQSRQLLLCWASTYWQGPMATKTWDTTHTNPNQETIAHQGVNDPHTLCRPRPWPRDRPSQLVGTEESAGKSHSVTGITLPACPHLCKSCKKFSCEPPFCLTVEIITRVDFLIENHIAAWMTKTRECLHSQHLCGTIRKVIPCSTNTGYPASEGTYNLLAICFLPFISYYYNSYFIKLLLLGLSYWDPDRALYSAPYLMPQSRAFSVHPLLPPAVNPPSPSLHKASQVPRKGQKDL